MPEQLLYMLIAAVALAGAVAIYFLETHRDAVRHAERRRAEQVKDDRLDWVWEQVDAVMEKHRPVLELKIRQALYRDAYGNWVYKAVWREAAYFVENVLFRELDWLPAERFEDDSEGGPVESWSGYIVGHALKIAATMDESGAPPFCATTNDGLHYERSVAAQLAALGFSIEFTARSGDQGVDVLAVRGDRRLAIQCKDYVGSVGNDAVQQVFAGAKFHEMNEAIVVSPARFTAAALQAGQRLGVACIHHEHLERHYSLAVPAAVAASASAQLRDEA